MLVDSLEPDDERVAAFLHEVEVARDPTHVRAYGEAQWRRICEQAGLEVVTVARHRKRRTFEFWLDRGGVEGDLRDQLRERFRLAPPDVRAALDIEVSEGRVEAFSDDKIVLLARRP